MTVRFLRAAATMAFPRGRLLAMRGSRAYLLAVDGWTGLGSSSTSSAQPLSREAATRWCAEEGWAVELLDQVPGDGVW
ncbi:hypothetical protein [Actinokineospora pegani]|uniref:hypothetical protein n=1 Tax=Actinokineospora pegani TaxID=2654637 RepID=UPI001F2B1500|nr:hypothetical protein [Actinokineospora pegani]